METININEIDAKIKYLKQEIKIWTNTCNEIDDIDSMFSGTYVLIYKLHIQELQHLIDILEILKNNERK